MSTIIVMPQLGESVAEGVIGKWLKNEGDHVAKDEALVEVITDKVNAEIPSPVAGVLERIAQPEGATVAVGGEIAEIGDGSAPTREAPPSGAGSSADGSAPFQAPGGGRPHFGGSNGGSGGVAVATAPSGQKGAIQNVPMATSLDRRDRVRSSPLVRRLAEQHGINLTEVSGTGIGGRVSKGDILAYVELKQTLQQSPASVVDQSSVPTEMDRQPVAPASQPAQTPHVIATSPAPNAATRGDDEKAARTLGPNEELVTVAPLRKLIAERMTLSMFTIPHATTNTEVDMTNVVRYREAKKDEFRQREGMPLSYVAFVIKATVEALKEFPMVNAEWAGDKIILKRDININVAVDAPDGLTTPIIHHADEKNLAGLSKAIYDLATRARNKKLRMEDMQGGTFTVNNTGALGSTGGVSIINYPQGGILAAAAIVKRAVVVDQDGQDLIAVRSMMNLSFSFDHRLLDGGYAMGFVGAVKRKLETWPSDYPVY